MSELVRQGATRLGAALLAIVAGLLSSHVHRVRAQGQASFVPFTAQFAKKNFGVSEVNYVTLARKSDGSEASYTTVSSPDGRQTGQVAEIRHASSGMVVDLEPFTMSAGTEYFPPRNVLPKGCPADISKYARGPAILGYATVLVRETEEIQGTPTSPGAGVRATDDRWLAPALGCLALRERYAWGSGPGNLTTAVSITRGEPPASLFRVPAGYVERSPAQTAALWEAKFPGHQFAPPATVAQWDRRYYARRSPR